MLFDSVKFCITVNSYIKLWNKFFVYVYIRMGIHIRVYMHILNIYICV